MAGTLPSCLAVPRKTLHEVGGSPRPRRELAGHHMHRYYVLTPNLCVTKGHIPVIRRIAHHDQTFAGFNGERLSRWRVTTRPRERAGRRNNQLWSSMQGKRVISQKEAHRVTAVSSSRPGRSAHVVTAIEQETNANDKSCQLSTIEQRIALHQRQCCGDVRRDQRSGPPRPSIDHHGSFFNHCCL